MLATQKLKLVKRISTLLRLPQKTFIDGLSDDNGIISRMKTEDFDYYLPAELIAQFPTAKRPDSRLLYLDSIHDCWQDELFHELPRFLRCDDVMVFNDTQVIKARLFGQKESGGKVEVMIERLLDDHHALASIRASHAPKPESRLLLSGTIPVSVVSRVQEFHTLRFEHENTVAALLDQYGLLPLPPYIDRKAAAFDETRYQTVYAKHAGAVAAPTAGLHFDNNMLEQLQKLGIRICYVTLHVGAGTFQPVRVKNISDHTMHNESYHIPQQTVDIINHAKQTNGRILAVGTTTLRALESCAFANQGRLTTGYGDTRLFITPGFRFQIVERLLTNFHLPRSTLLMLVSAFAGIDNIRQAYQHAIQARYRFFSYGDAMLMERKS